MIVRIDIGERLLEPRAVRLIVEALTALVLHDLALIVELRLGERLDKSAHAVGLEPQGEIELVRWHLLEVIGAIPGSRAVDVRAGTATGFLQQRPVLPVSNVARALEHHVLEEVSEAGLARLLALRADVVHDLYGNDGRRVVDTVDDVEPVWQGVLHVRDFDLGSSLSLCRSWSND